MIGILAGWVRDRLFHPIFHLHDDGAGTEIEAEKVPGEAEGFQQASTGLQEGTLTPSQAGIHFQLREFKALMWRVGKWDSVRFMKVNGEPINSIGDVSRGPDGGIDAIIVISTPTPHGSKIVAGRIRTILRTQDY